MKHVLFLLFAIFSFSGYGQNPDQWEKYGDEAAAEKDHYGAAYYYAKALALDSENLHIHKKMAESYRLNNNYGKALKAYSSLSRNDKEEKYPEAVFWHALMLKHNERYLEAADKFELYRKAYKYESVELTKKAEREAESCLWAAEHQHDSTDTEIRLLPRPVNSFDAELSPRLDADSVFYFASWRFDSLEQKKLADPKTDYKTRIFSSKLDSNGQIVIEAPEELNMKGKHSANYFLHREAGYAFITVCDPLCDIYYAVYSGEGAPLNFSPLDGVNASGSTDTGPHMAKIGDKYYLFFASDRARGVGNMDIWYCELRGEKFTRPRNLRSINSKGNELTPWYDTAREELYFSSDWHNGYGGYDVFKAGGTPPRLSTPENLLKPINSPANDLYYNGNIKYLTGHLVSNRAGGFAIKGETCCNNIYEFDMSPPPEKPVLADIPEEEPTDTVPPVEPKPDPPVFVAADIPPVTLYFPNDHPDPKSTGTKTDKTYDDVLDIYLGLTDSYSKENPDFEEQFVKKYLTGKTDDLIAPADTVKSLVAGGNRVYIMMRGFASPLASSTYNERLTSRRISSVENSILHYDETLKIAHQEGRLHFVRMPLGEYEAGLEDVNDRLDDLKNSVYGMAAAKARKVEITKVIVQNADVPAAVPTMDTYTRKIGRNTKTASFNLSNIGNDTLVIKEVKTDGNTTLKSRPNTVPPGESTDLTFEVATNKTGIFKITLITDDRFPDVDLYIVKE